MYTILFAVKELEQLKKDARNTLQSAYALGTFDNLHTQWVKFLRFCVYFQLIPFPASTMVLVWYAQFLSRTHKSHASVVSYLSGVKTLHILLNQSIRGFAGFLLKMTLRGLRRTNTHVVKRAKPMTPTLLRQIHAVLNHNNPIHAIFWGICILAFLLLFRKSNLVPDKVNEFNGEKQLRHGDCVIDRARNRVIVGIRWAKNQQFKRELMTFPLPSLTGSVLCPVKAVDNIRKLIPGTESEHLFQLPMRGSMTSRRFQEMLREILKQLGVPDYSAYSSHSFRRGGTTFCFLCGIPTEIIRVLGCWSSDAFLAYLEFPIETRTAACELIKMRILAMEKIANS